jgi:hypothetical protein
MTASLADRRELARPPSAFAAFQGHFLSAFAACRTAISAIASSSIDSQQYIVRMAGCEEAAIKPMEV